MTNTILDDASAALTNMWKMRICICISATKWNDENEKWKRWKWNEIFWWLLCLLRHVYKSKTLVPYTQWHNAWHTQALHLWFWYTWFSYKYNRVTVSVQRDWVEDQFPNNERLKYIAISNGWNGDVSKF